MQSCLLTKFAHWVSCSCAGRKSVVTKVFGHIEPNWWKHGYFSALLAANRDENSNSGKIFTILKLNFRWIVSRSICKSKHKSKQWIWFRLKRSTRTRNHSTSSHLLRLCYLTFVKKKKSQVGFTASQFHRKKRTHAMHTLLNTLFEWFMYFFPREG